MFDAVQFRPAVYERMLLVPQVVEPPRGRISHAIERMFGWLKTAYASLSKLVPFKNPQKKIRSVVIWIRPDETDSETIWGFKLVRTNKGATQVLDLYFDCGFLEMPHGSEFNDLLEKRLQKKTPDQFLNDLFSDNLLI